MKKHVHLIILILMVLGNSSCKAQKKNLTDFVPNDYVIYEKVYGDLNKDGLEDCILIIKGTDKKNVVLNRFNKKVDRNRRGIVVLFKKNNEYELVVKSDTCFSSENEDGGAYYQPELSIKIKKGNLYIHYAHGRYGYWKYTFRLQNSDFDLIGYDQTNGGVVIESEVSINFLTKKKLIRENTNVDAEAGDEIFKETWKKVALKKPIKLSEINKFDEFKIPK